MFLRDPTAARAASHVFACRYSTLCRRYVKSRSDPQLRGSGAAVLEDCRPQEYEGGDAGRPANPCGLVAWSLFNDSFSV